MSPTAKKELLKTIAPRYQKSRRKERSKILDEFCANFNYNRKYAIRKLLGYKLKRRPGITRKPGPGSLFSKSGSSPISHAPNASRPSSRNGSPPTSPSSDSSHPKSSISSNPSLRPPSTEFSNPSASFTQAPDALPPSPAFSSNITSPSKPISGTNQNLASSKLIP